MILGVEQVHPSSVYEFEVVDREGQKWAVNLREKTCSCRVFQTDNFICPHGIAACGVRNFAVEKYISNYYTTEYWRSCYAGVIHPIGSEESWNFPEEVTQKIVNPPHVAARAAGRPKKKRIPSQWEGDEDRRNKCSRYGGVGHNRATCRNAIPTHHSRPRT